MWRATTTLMAAGTATTSLTLRRVAATTWSPTLLRSPSSVLITSARFASTQGFSSADGPNGEAGSDREQQTSSSSSSYFGAYRNFRQSRHRRQDVQYQTLSMYLDRLPPVVRELLLYSPLLALLYFLLVQARVYYLDEEEPWYHLLLPARWRHGASGSVKHVSSLLQRAPLTDSDVSRSMTRIAFAVDMGPGASATLTATGNEKGHGTVELQKDGDGSFTANLRDADVTATVTTATTYRYGAKDVHDAAAASNSSTAASPLVAPFHSVTVLRVEAEHVTGSAHHTTGSEDRTQLKVVKKTKDAEVVAAAKAVAEAHPYGVWQGPLRVLRDPSTNRVMGYSTAAAA